MFFTLLNRVRLLSLLPKNGTVAELGVDNAGFSRRILEFNKPKKLHLIDPWGGKDDEYVKTYGVKDPMEDRYRRVLDVLSEPLGSGQAEIHRGYSYDVFPSFADNYFDWVFVDGMHTFEAVKQDLLLVDNKVKSDGFIVGHDFSNTGRANFGVIPAVLEFLESRPSYKLLCVTYERAPSYLIAKNPDGETARLLEEQIIDAQPSIFELPVSDLPRLRQVPLKVKEGRANYAFSLADGASR